MLFDLLPSPSMLISYVLVLMTAFAVHEFAHAFTANLFGDKTAAREGRLTLNPFAHLDVMGSLMLLVAGFGWAKPVPVNVYTLERHSRLAPLWVALAGPISNLLMAVLFAIPFQLGLINSFQAYTSILSETQHILPTLPQLCLVFVQTNLLLMLFNLIPVAPLDGDKVLYYLLPPNGQRLMDQFRPYGPILLLILVFGGYLLPGFDPLSWILFRPMGMLLNLLVG